MASSSNGFVRHHRVRSKSLRQLVNYEGHPGHGAAAGFIWAQNDPGSPPHEAGFNGSYWSSRLRASAWIVAYSLQFELEPVSEASIGNVGKNPRTTG